jgi:hypothetical protein
MLCQLALLFVTGAVAASAQTERGNLRDSARTTRTDGTLDLTMLWSRGQAT